MRWVWRHPAAFNIVPGGNSSSLIFYPIWLKFGAHFKYIRFERAKAIFTKNWKFCPSAPWQKPCHGNSLGYCRLKTISNDALYNYTKRISSTFYQIEKTAFYMDIDVSQISLHSMLTSSLCIMAVIPITTSWGRKARCSTKHNMKTKSLIF